MGRTRRSVDSAAIQNLTLIGGHGAAGPLQGWLPANAGENTTRPRLGIIRVNGPGYVYSNELIANASANPSVDIPRLSRVARNVPGHRFRLTSRSSHTAPELVLHPEVGGGQRLEPGLPSSPAPTKTLAEQGFQGQLRGFGTDQGNLVFDVNDFASTAHCCLEPTASSTVLA